MKIIYFLAVLSFPLLGISATKKLTCENKNIKFEIEDSWFKDLKYKYTDTKRKVSAIFAESLYIMSGSDEGDFSSLEMMMSADGLPYTAIIEDYEAFKKYKTGTKGIPLFIKTENKNGREVHINTFCDMVK